MTVCIIWLKCVLSKNLTTASAGMKNRFSKYFIFFSKTPRSRFTFLKITNSLSYVYSCKNDRPVEPSPCLRLQFRCKWVLVNMKAPVVRLWMGMCGTEECPFWIPFGSVRWSEKRKQMCLFNENFEFMWSFKNLFFPKLFWFWMKDGECVHSTSVVSCLDGKQWLIWKLCGYSNLWL